MKYKTQAECWSSEEIRERNKVLQINTSLNLGRDSYIKSSIYTILNVPAILYYKIQLYYGFYLYYTKGSNKLRSRITSWCN